MRLFKRICRGLIRHFLSLMRLQYKGVKYLCFVIRQLATGNSDDLGYISYYTNRFFHSKPVHPSMILRKIKGENMLDGSDTLCLFCHFDIHALIDDHVIYTLQKLRDELNAAIVFVSNSESLSDAEIDKIRHLCALILVRRNEGLDFAGWKQGLECVGSLDAYSRILLTNDSIYGPFFSLEHLPELLPDDHPAILGLTRSYSGIKKEYLQSYFLMFNKPAFSGEWFKRFWKSVKSQTLYASIVYFYEIGLSQYAIKAGVELIPYINNTHAIRVAIAEEERPDYWQQLSLDYLNPTIALWRQLMLHYRFPYMKVRVLRDKYAEVPNLGTFFKTLEHVSEYPPELIVNHLQRVAPNAVVLDHFAAGKH